MIPRIIVLDTGVLLAIALGADLDSKAAPATVALDEAARAGVRLVVPPSVRQELGKKLLEIDSVYTILQSAASNLYEFQSSDSPLATAEKVMGKIGESLVGAPRRYLESVESELGRILTASPATDLPTAFAMVAGNAFTTKERIRLRSRPPLVEFLDAPDPDLSPLVPPIPEVKGPDLAHVRACQELGDLHGLGVVFLVLERPLHRRRSEVHERFPKVEITTPPYLSAYLH